MLHMSLGLLLNVCVFRRRRDDRDLVYDSDSDTERRGRQDSYRHPPTLKRSPVQNLERYYEERRARSSRAPPVASLSRAPAHEQGKTLGRA